MAHDVPPKFEAPAFNCPRCGTYSKQMWLDVQRHYPTKAAIDGKELRMAQCTTCNKMTFWLDGKMLSPDSLSAPSHDPDQADEIKKD